VQAAIEDDADVATAMLETITDALHLDRAALAVRTPGESSYAIVAHVGRPRPRPFAADAPPSDGPWSAVVPVALDGDPIGLLLLALPGGAALTATDQHRARGCAEGLARIHAHGRLRADLARTTALLARTDRLTALGTLAAGVVHEIRNPLVSVRTFLQLLPERIDDPAFRTEFRELALSEVERICELINDLLGFARPQVAAREPVDLGAVVTQTLRLLDPDLRRQRIAVDLRTDPTLGPVLADDGQVRQVILNLIANAVDACGGPGEVSVHVLGVRDTERDWAVLRVGDSGPGIAPADAARLFDAFFTTKPHGSGLGLSIVQQIVTEHGGQIRTEQRVGGGAQFSIFFPLPAERPDGRA
jgi:signal transduction histidine kinase